VKITNLILSNDANTTTRILILTGIAWLPLVLLTLIDGTFITTEITMSFVRDVIPYVRCLIVIPLLIMADNVIEPMMLKTTAYLRSSSIVPVAEQADFDNALVRMAYLINAKWIQVILVLLAILVSWVLQADYVDMWTERGVTSWALHLEGNKVDETLAGQWYLLVSSPLVSFLLYRWIWRFIVWSALLFIVSRMKLDLYASHTDLSGGLGIIGYGQSLFVIIFVVVASVLASDMASNILYEGEKLIDVRLVVLVFIAFSLIVIAAPLFFFTNKLISLKRKALADYGALQQQISRDFHHHWIDNKAQELVDSMQPSAMADYSAVYEIASNMRVVPMNPKTIFVLAAVLFVPFLPLALTEQTIWDVLKMIGDSIL
jgi:hypothetical protein